MTTIAKGVEPLKGVRMYSLIKEDENFFLKGKYDQVWRTSAIDALCKVQRNNTAFSDDKLAKDAEEHLRNGLCNCGIYIVPEEQRYHHSYWRGMMYRINKVEVEASMSAWGLCIEGTQAYRCQHASIDELTILTPICEACGVPAEFFSLSASNNLCGFCCTKFGVAGMGDVVRWDELDVALRKTYNVDVNIRPLLPEDTLQMYPEDLFTEYPIPESFPRKFTEKYKNGPHDGF